MNEASRNRKSAFTLIELLAVIGIIVVLVGIVMAGAGYAGRAADRSRARAQIQIIQTALDRYNEAFTRYPSNITVNVGSRPGVYSNMVSMVPELLRIPVQTNTGPNPDIVEFMDPWGQPIAYRKFKDDTCELRSMGPDGQSNTVDDITSSRGD